MSRQSSSSARLPPVSSLLWQDYSISDHRTEHRPTYNDTEFYEGPSTYPRHIPFSRHRESNLYDHKSSPHPSMIYQQVSPTDRDQSPRFVYRQEPTSRPEPHQQYHTPPQTFPMQSHSPLHSLNGFPPPTLLRPNSSGSPPYVHANIDERHSPIPPSNGYLFPGPSSFEQSQVLLDSKRFNVEEDQSYKSQKRLRISRACQHCKSRKTRCDAIGGYANESSHSDIRLTQTEGGEEIERTAPATTTAEEEQSMSMDMIVIQPCTNCIRGGTSCVYSKRALKRGPSKGYMKELEKRLDTLENSLERRASFDECGEKSQRPEARLLKLENTMSSRKESPPSPSEKIDKRERKKSEVQSAPTTPVQTESKAHSTRSWAKARREETNSNVKTAFLASHLNQCLPVLDSLNYTNTLETEVDEGLLIRAIKLLVEPLEVEETRMRSTHSGSPTPSRYPLTARRRSSTSMRIGPSQQQRLERLVGQTLMASQGLQAKEITVGFSHWSASPDTVEVRRSSQINPARQLGVESDTLILCYLTGLRRGQAGSAALAAAVHKLTKMGDPSSDNVKGRRVVAVMVDRWHCVGFHLPSVMPTIESYASLLHALPQDDTTTNTDTCEVLRGAIAFGLFREAVQQNRTSKANIQAILASVELDQASDVLTCSDEDGLQAMRKSIRNALLVYRDLHQSPKYNETQVPSSVLAVEKMEEQLGLIESSLPASSHMLQSYVGPFILSIFIVQLIWSSRTVTILARQYLHSKLNSHPHLLRLELIRKRILSGLGLISEEILHNTRRDDQGSFSLLHARVAMFAQANVQYVDQIGNLGNVIKLNDLKSDSPVLQTDQIVQGEANGILEVFHNLGPLGLALSTTNNYDAWKLLGKGTLI